MKNFAKLSVLGIFALFSFVWFVNGPASAPGYRARAQAQPTPPANTAVNANSSNTVIVPAANGNSSNTSHANLGPANIATPTPEAAGDQSIPANFTLGTKSVAVHGEVAFNHANHAFKMYSADGKSVVGCTVCHHTDQPKSALKLPLQTSEREVALTLESWKASSQKKVSTCASCHFQNGEVPDGKTMPVVGEMQYNNEEAYHKNCNECHDAAAKARPELNGKQGFATSTGCFICHKKNE
jgi:cytochrome c553